MENLKESSEPLLLRPKELASSKIYDSLPLTEAGPFRLLTLLPSTIFSSSIQCTLSVSNFSTASYQALSYCWGDVKATISMIVNDTNFQATENLVSALRHLRHKKDDLVIWVDAICINQNDLNERNAQVQQMGLIYSKAQLVVCWLGEAKDDSHLAFRMMKAWGDVLLRSGLTSPSQIIKELYGEAVLTAVKEIDDPFNLRAWQAVFMCLDRPWWCRVWIVQEFVLGQDVILKCGEDRLSWHGLSAVSAASKPDVRRKIGLQHYNIIRAASIYLHRMLFQTRTEETFGLRAMLSLALYDNSMRLSTDPRDKVYGMLGLMDASGHSLMQVDYHLSLEEIYVIIARQSMLVSPHTEEDPILDLLQEAGTSNRAPSFSGKIPSWVPDWKPFVPFGGTTSTLPSSKYSATQGLHSVPQFSNGGMMLHVWGAVLDRVVMIFAMDQLPGGKKWPWLLDEVWEIARLLDGGEYPSGTTRLEALFRTTTCDISPLRQRWADDLVTAHAYLAMFCMEMAEEKLEMRSQPGRKSYSLEAIRQEKDMPITTGFGSIFSSTNIGFPRFPENYDFDQGLKIYSELSLIWGEIDYTRKRCYFSTAETYLGLGPAEMKEGDLVCVLFGSNLPFVLREDNGEYILIGEAYIHGFMDGEAMAQIEAGTLTAQEFAIK
jgi:Heterokaryon incompatibility protein (HET)